MKVAVASVTVAFQSGGAVNIGRMLSPGSFTAADGTGYHFPSGACRHRDDYGRLLRGDRVWYALDADGRVDWVSSCDPQAEAE